MPNRINVPDELASLIEKREQDDRRQDDNSTPANAETPQAKQADSEQERRTGKDRRAND